MIRKRKRTVGRPVSKSKQIKASLELVKKLENEVKALSKQLKVAIRAM